MGFGFERPIGASADVAELEYISALHQTDVQELRQDGTIDDQDISLYLSSRYGLRNTPQQIRERVLADLGCGSMDLVTLVSVLLIPKLKKEATRSDSTLLDYALSVIRHDVFLNEDDVNLNKDTLKRILSSVGELELASDENLLDEMLLQAGITNDDQDTPLSVETFAQALTRDIGLYNLDNSTSLSTNMHDVMAMEETGATELDQDDEEAVRSKEGGLGEPNKTEFSVTGASIDFTADTYRSRPLVVAMWSYFVLSFFTYFYGFDFYDILPDCEAFGFRSSWAEEANTLGCHIGWSVGTWMQTLLFMSVYGILYFGLVGIGNSIESTEPLKPLFGAIMAAVYTYVPFYIRGSSDNPQMAFLRLACFCIGTCIVLCNLWHFVALLIPKNSKLYKNWEYYLTPEAIRAEALVKQAAQHKIDRMVSNALDMHRMKTTGSAVDSHIGQALWNYAKMGQTKTEQTGGLVWTWTRIWSLELFQEEGLWFSARLVAINLAQVIVAVFVLILGLVATIMIVGNYSPPETSVQALLDSIFETTPKATTALSIVDTVAWTVGQFLVRDTSLSCGETDISTIVQCEPSTNLDSCLPTNTTWLCAFMAYSNTTDPADVVPRIQTGLLARAGFETRDVYNSAMSGLFEAARGSVDSLYPTDKHMILVPLLVATFVAFLTAASIAASMIPSIVSTTMKLRAGIIPLMHNPKAITIRIAPDQVATLQGTLFWGTLFSSALMAAFWGGIVFLFMWQATSNIAQRLMATIVGILAVVLTHFLIVFNCRFVTSKAYYRRRVLTANLVLLARECAFFALTVGFVLVRVAKLLFTTILFVGRVDRPFLADGVGEIEVFGFRLDNYPYVFRMEILQHEAHRHPYLESLGVMYLMKWRYGSNFCSRAGTAWRMLLVMVMMPWLSKYRQSAKCSKGMQDPKVMVDGLVSEAFTVKALRSSVETTNLEEELREEIAFLKAELEKANGVVQTGEEHLRRGSQGIGGVRQLHKSETHELTS